MFRFFGKAATRSRELRLRSNDGAGPGPAPVEVSPRSRWLTPARSPTNQLVTSMRYTASSVSGFRVAAMAAVSTTDGVKESATASAWGVLGCARKRCGCRSRKSWLARRSSATTSASKIESMVPP